MMWWMWLVQQCMSVDPTQQFPMPTCHYTYRAAEVLYSSRYNRVAIDNLAKEIFEQYDYPWI